MRAHFVWSIDRAMEMSMPSVNATLAAKAAFYAIARACWATSLVELVFCILLTPDFGQQDIPTVFPLLIASLSVLQPFAALSPPLGMGFTYCVIAMKVPLLATFAAYCMSNSPTGREMIAKSCVMAFDAGFLTAFISVMIPFSEHRPFG